MNSDELIQPNLLVPQSTPTIPALASFETSLETALPQDFSDLPLDDLLEKRVCEMTDQELAQFVKMMAGKRASAAQLKAGLRAESDPTKPKTRSSKKTKTMTADELAKMLETLLG